MRAVLLTGIYGLAAWSVLWSFLSSPGINDYEKARFADMVYERAHQPFVCRALAPLVIRTLTRLTPESIRAKTAAVLAGSDEVRLLGWEREYLYEYGLCALLAWCCFVGFAFVMRELLREFYSPVQPAVDLVALIALLAVPLHFRYVNYIYDPLTLLLFSLGILFIARRRHGWFSVCFIFASINKETAILLLPLYLLWEHRCQPLPKTLIQAGVLALVWLGIKIGLSVIYRDNPGSIAEFQLSHNLALFARPMVLGRFALTLAIWAWLIGSGWRAKSEFLRRALLATFLPLIFAAVFLGYIDELRGYYECLPLAFLLAWTTVAAHLGHAKPSAVH